MRSASQRDPLCVWSAAVAGLKKLVAGYEMDRVGSLAEWAGASGEKSFPGFTAEVHG